jgi:transcriptional regulator with XRE-family HTH domain
VYLRYTSNVPKLGKLRAVRDAAFLSQQELAEKSGITKTAIVRLEKGQASAQPRTVRALAKALEVAPSDLVGEFE